MPVLQRLIFTLLVGALGLPIVLCVLILVAKLLEGMGDPAGRSALEAVALGLGIAWAVDLICLIILQAVHGLGGVGPPDDVE